MSIYPGIFADRQIEFLFASVNYVEGLIPFNITCGTLLKYQILLAFTGAVSVAGITLMISAVSKNQTAALAASAAVHLFLQNICQASGFMNKFAENFR